MLGDKLPQVCGQSAGLWDAKDESASIFFSRKGQQADLIRQPQRGDILDQIAVDPAHGVRSRASWGLPPAVSKFHRASLACDGMVPISILVFGGPPLGDPDRLCGSGAPRLVSHHDRGARDVSP